MACRMATPVLIGETFRHNIDFGSFRLLSFDKEKETAIFSRERDLSPQMGDKGEWIDVKIVEYGWKEMIPEVHPYPVLIAK